MSFEGDVSQLKNIKLATMPLFAGEKFRQNPMLTNWRPEGRQKETTPPNELIKVIMRTGAEIDFLGTSGGKGRSNWGDTA